MFAGESLGLVGESGSGKSTLALSILRLLKHTGAQVTGEAVILGTDLMRCGNRELRDIRGRLVSFIPQSPVAALNPALRIETQFREAWRAHSSALWSEQKVRVEDLLVSVGLGEDASFLRRYPGEISVGQAQRVLIAMALLHAPPLLIADEPTSALDVITQRDVLELLRRIGKQRSMTILFISHDLPTVSTLCSRLAILYRGEIIESGQTTEILTSPQHAYTRHLVAAIPRWPK